MGLYKRGDKWYLDEIIEGYRVHRSLKTNDRRNAEAEATAIRTKIQETARRKRLGLPDDSKHEAAAGAALTALVEEFAKELDRDDREFFRLPYISPA